MTKRRRRLVVVVGTMMMKRRRVRRKGRWVLSHSISHQANHDCKSILR